MVTTVLVLDQSGSMRDKAEDGDTKSKMDALKEAASRFVDLMRPEARTTLLPFSDVIGLPKPFTSHKGSLKAEIARLKPLRGTLLYDATYAGLETVIAHQVVNDVRDDGGKGGLVLGKRAVVVLTDGVDEAPGSRRSDQDVIDRAKEAGIPLYMLGLGRREEINEEVMDRMARSTGGKYYHAQNQQKLIEIFENLSIELHDDGIDEKALTHLAEETGGKYYHARAIKDLSLVYERVASQLKPSYQVTYRSPRGISDGTKRRIGIKIKRDGTVSKEATGGYVTRGVVPAQMDAVVYLVLLGGLVGLLALPEMLRRTTRG